VPFRYLKHAKKDREDMAKLFDIKATQMPTVVSGSSYSETLTSTVHTCI
jgi:hypothetical protein